MKKKVCIRSYTSTRILQENALFSGKITRSPVATNFNSDHSHPPQRTSFILVIMVENYMFSQSSKKYQTDAMLVKISSDTKIACKNFPTISRESKNSKICSFPHIDLVLVSTAVQRLHAASLGALIFSSNRLHNNNMHPVGGAQQQS